MHQLHLCRADDNLFTAVMTNLALCDLLAFAPVPLGAFHQRRCAVLQHLGVDTAFLDVVQDKGIVRCSAG
jgi:hypothetical protein